MKLCFLAVFNTCNEIAYKILKEKGLDFTYHIRRMFADLCKAYLIEARWYHAGYIPTLEEYLNNAWVTSAGPLVLGHIYCYMIQDVTKEGLECLLSYPNPIQCSSIILRLCDDMSTFSEELKRGDVPTAIQCYMHHENVSESAAVEHVKGVISETWKQLNEEHFSCSVFGKPFLDSILELVRSTHTFYLHGDGFSSPDQEIKEKSMALLVKPLH